MSEFTPAMDAALRGDTPTVFGAISIDLPGYKLNLIDGAGQLSFGGATYVGEDATFGILADIENLADGTGDSAPALGIGLLPNGDASAAALAGPAMQGSSVSIYLGAVDPATGMAIPEPLLVFVGELDVPTLHSGDSSRRLDYEVVSVFERLFEDDESARLSDGFHQSLFPGELGLAFVTGVETPVYWGVAGNNAATVSYGGAYSGGRGGAPFETNQVEV